MSTRFFVLIALLASITALGACENTYRGAGQDLDEVSDEMKDGYN